MSTNKSDAQDSHRSIIKSTSILSLGTLASRVLGFFRDVILAKLLGTGLTADAFFVALKIPNLFRDLAGEGATNAAIVPVLSEYKEKKDREDFWNFAGVLLALAFIILSVITILGVVFAPVLVRLMAPGFMADPAKLSLTIRLTKGMFPYLVLMGLAAYSMGILFTFRSFTVTAFSPCLLNIAVIISALIAFRTMREPVFGLAVGVLAGGVLQLAFQFHALSKIGMRYRWPKTLRHPGAVQVGKLLIPRIMGSGVYQLNVFIDTFCASLSMIVGQGGISAIYYANRIIQLPMGIFGVALASAVLPALSKFASKNDIPSIKKTVVFSLENIFFVMCPTTVILLLLADPVIRVLFQRGEFGFYSTMITASTLSYYAIGLFSFGGIKILVTAFYALQDTKTPVKAAALCLVVNAILNFVLMSPLKVGGIALASSISGTLDFLILFYVLDKRLDGLDFDLPRYVVKVLSASGATGVVLFGFWYYVPAANEILKMIAAGFLSLLTYGTISLALKIEQAQKTWKWILRRN